MNSLHSGFVSGFIFGVLLIVNLPSMKRAKNSELKTAVGTINRAQLPLQ